MRALLLVIILFISSYPALAEQDAYEIMHQVEQQAKKYKTLSSEVFMQINDDKENIRERYFTHQKKHYSDKTKAIIKFYKPANVKGTALLTHFNEDSWIADQWIFLPALRSIKQLSSKDKHDSFMGSDFSYSDVAGRNLNQDEHQLIKETEQYYFIRSRPKNNKEDPYLYIDFIIKKDIFVPLKLVFFNKNGEILKTLINKKIEKFSDVYLVTEAEMENHLNHSKTTLNISKVIINADISDNALGVSSLK